MTGTGTLTLTNTNSYSGSTTIDAGTLVVTANGAMGPATATGIVVNAGGVLAFAGGVDDITAEPITIRAPVLPATAPSRVSAAQIPLPPPSRCPGRRRLAPMPALTLGGNINLPRCGPQTLTGCRRDPDGSAATSTWVRRATWLIPVPDRTRSAARSAARPPRDYFASRGSSVTISTFPLPET